MPALVMPGLDPGIQSHGFRDGFSGWPLLAKLLQARLATLRLRCQRRGQFFICRLQSDAPIKCTNKKAHAQDVVGLLENFRQVTLGCRARTRGQFACEKRPPLDLLQGKG